MSDRQEVIDRITGHFRETMGDVRTVEVPEWGLVGEQAIHIRPATLLELQTINRKGGPNGNDVAILAETLIVRARKADGTPIFSTGYRDVLMREADPDILARVVTEINDDRSTKGGTTGKAK